MFEAAIAQPSILSDFAQNCISAVGTGTLGENKLLDAAPLHCCVKTLCLALYSGVLTFLSLPLAGPSTFPPQIDLRVYTTKRGTDGRQQ